MGLVLDNNLNLSSVSGVDTYPPRIGINNLFRASGGTVTASAEATGGEKENGYKEGFTHDFWRPGSSGDQWLRVSLGSSAKADYLAIAAHDLHQNSGIVKAQYSTDGGSSWSDAHSAMTPGDSRPLMVLFTESEAADWRLHVSSTGAVSIGSVSIGKVTKMAGILSSPWTPPYLDRDLRYVNEQSEGGQFVGRSVISKGTEFQLDFRGVDLSWMRDTWDPLIRTVEQYPFFFTARDLDASGGREQEVVYAWTTRQPSASYESNLYGRIRLRCRGIID